VHNIDKPIEHLSINCRDIFINLPLFFWGYSFNDDMAILQTAVLGGGLSSRGIHTSFPNEL
jgi:hypothetical protein